MTTLNLEEVAVFLRVAAGGSLSDAARQLGLTPQIASRRLAALESYLGVRLVHRTTRQATLTVDGESFLIHAERLLAEAAAAEAAVGKGRSEARGLLRMTAPHSFAQAQIVPLIPALLAAHPHLRIDLQSGDRVVDLVEEGIDLAIRIAPLKDSSLTARKLADNPLHLVAAPRYLADRGTPTSLADLSMHDCLTRTGGDVWVFKTPAGEKQMRVGGRFTANANDPLREMAIAGLGLGLHSHWDVAASIARGELVELRLADATPPVLGIWALWPGPRSPSPKVRVMVDALTAALASGTG